MPTSWPGAGRPDGRDRLRARRQEEANLLAQVRAAAALLGWACYHTRNSRGSEAGWPDLILCRPPTLLVAELKAPGARPTARQRAWLVALRACGLRCYVWRPADWPQIRRLLEAPPGPLPDRRAALEAVYATGYSLWEHVLDDPAHGALVATLAEWQAFTAALEAASPRED